MGVALYGTFIAGNVLTGFHVALAISAVVVLLAGIAAFLGSYAKIGYPRASDSRS
jgi:hypothetical protein